MGNNAPISLGCWQPLSPHEVATLLAPQPAPWWIAGGWALDLFLGGQTRAHDDIDVQILRRDQRRIRAALGDWDVQGALPPPRPDHWPFEEWRRDEDLDPAIHDVWCRPRRDAPWAVQLMVGESEGDEWIYHRAPRIRRALGAVGRRTDAGIPYLVPEIQLLYKAKAPRPKDEADFARVAPYLDDDSRHWLRDVLASVYPAHGWGAALECVLTPHFGGRPAPAKCSARFWGNG